MIPEHDDERRRLLKLAADVAEAKKMHARDLGSGDVLSGLSPAEEETEQRVPTDETGREIAPAGATIRYEDTGFWEPDFDPARRKPLEIKPGVVAELAPLPATDKPRELVPQEPRSEGKGFDWARGLAGLFEGSKGIANIDAGRSSQNRIDMDRRQALLNEAREKRLSESDLRRSESESFGLDEQKRRSMHLQSMSDPKSPQSQSMREQLSAKFETYASLYPESLPMLKRFAANFQNMSANDLLSADEMVGKVIGVIGSAKHTAATEAMARRRIEQGDEQNAATWAASNQARADREESKDEAAIVAHGKEAKPIENAIKTLGEVKDSKSTTGWLPAVVFQPLRQALNIKDEDWDTAETALFAVSNSIRHDEFGGNVTPGERADWLKQLPDMKTPRNAFNVKLATVMRLMAEKKAGIDETHPRAMKAKAKGKPSATPPQKNVDPGKASQLVQARKWLADHPDDPRSEAVKAQIAKLEGK